MRILHVSNEDLPDWRVEKAAFTALNRGHETYFAGPKSSNYSSKAFNEVYDVRWIPDGPLGWLPAATFGNSYAIGQVRKQLLRVIEIVKPDIIHAHNIFAAKIVSSLGTKYIYDDHEFWSSFARLTNESATAKILLRLLSHGRVKEAGWLSMMRYAIRLWRNWENEIVSSTPVITISEAVAQHHKSTHDGKGVFVVPNFPASYEVKDFNSPKEHRVLSSVYAGSDSLDQVRPHRNIKGFSEVFAQNDVGKLVMIGVEGTSSERIIYKGFLSRKSMYNEMFESSVGILPWKEHWSHSYVSPNKPYEYAHAGLLVMCTTSFTEVRRILGEHCIVFEDYKELKEQLDYCQGHPNEIHDRRLKSFDYARTKLLWENYENNIIDAYRHGLNL